MNISSEALSHPIHLYKTSLLKALNRLFAIACLISLPQLGLAIPYVDSLRTAKDSWNTITYAKIVWPPEDSSEVVCRSFIGCSIQACITGKVIFNTCTGDRDENYVNIDNNATLKEAREAWVNKYGVVSKEFRFIHKDVKEDCITFGVGVGVGNPIPFSGVTCVPTGKINVTCTVSDKLDFTYNTLNSDQVNNAEAYGTLAVKCSGAATVDLRLVGPSEIDLGRNGTLRAKLNIANTDLADGYSFNGGTTTTSLKVTSVLQSSLQEAETGTFKGEGIIVMNVQ